MTVQYRESTSSSRYASRQRRWISQRKVMPRARHHVWWLLHNCLSHPWLAVDPSSEAALWFHDRTSQRLNLSDRLRPSGKPAIKDRAAWIWHNLAGHVAIGLLPIDAVFRFHDRTAEAMDVPDWV